MPALGMSQDEGTIVSWLKAPGDEVAEGDPLFEVETDKAVQEVEAEAAGWLADVTAEAGATVPVGEVVARIADSPDAAEGAESRRGEDKDDGADEGDEPAADGGGDGGDRREIIMPALGMSQDEGTIVAWLKERGDAVAEGDPLLEIETDKAVQEIEAEADGYLAEIRAEAGSSVPVGEIIAVLTVEKPAASPGNGARSALSGDGDHPGATGGGTDGLDRAGTDHGSSAERSAADGQERDPSGRRDVARHTNGRILASPKARRLAAERGIDLSRLAESGRAQPFHVADLDTVPEPDVDAEPAPAPAVTRRLTAEAQAAAFDAFRAFLAGELDDPPAAEAILAAFAAAALRSSAEDREAPIAVALGEPAGPVLVDPDHAGLGQISGQNAAEGTAPDLVIADYSDTPLTDMDGGTGGVPEIVVTRAGDNLRVRIAYADGRLDRGAALAVAGGLTDRVRDPLRHLL